MESGLWGKRTKRVGSAYRNIRTPPAMLKSRKDCWMGKESRQSSLVIMKAGSGCAASLPKGRPLELVECRGSIGT